MTKLKNTKKGMAKKALSISLVAAMLATSNVPVWAAEFSDGTEAAPVVVEESADVEAFSDAAPVENTVVEEANTAEAVASVDINAQSYTSNVAVQMNSNGWGNAVTVTGSVKDKDGEIAGVEYTWLANGVQASGQNATGETYTLNSVTYTPTKDDFNKTLALQVTIKNGSTIVYQETITGGVVGAQVLTTTTEPTFKKGVYYNGKEQKATPSNRDDFKFSSLGITPEQFTWNYSTSGNDFTNVTGKEIKVTGTLEGTYDRTSTAYGYTLTTPEGSYTIKALPITSANLVAEMKTTSVQYIGSQHTFDKSDVTLQVKVDADSNTKVDITDALKSTATFKGNGIAVGTGYTVSIGTNSLDTTSAAAKAILKNFKVPTTNESARTSNTYAITILDLSSCTGEITEYTLDAFKKNPTVAAGNITLTNADGNSFALSAISNDVTIQVNQNAIDAANNGLTGTIQNAVTVSYKADTKNVTGSISLPLTLTTKSLNNVTVTVKKGNAVQTLSGSTATSPAFTVPYIAEAYDLQSGKYGLTEFTVNGLQSTEYAVSYDDNVNAGVVKVTITGLLSYAGSVKNVYFKINQTKIAEDSVSMKDSVTVNPANNNDASLYKDALGLSVAQELYAGNGKVTLTDDKDYTVKYYYAKTKGLTTEAAIKADAGDNVARNYVYAVVKAASNGNYTSDTIIKSAQIMKKSISDVTISVEKASYTYTGKEIVPEITVKDGTVVLEKGVDFSMKVKDNVNVGTATITITPLAGSDYDTNSTATATFEITAAKAEDVTVTLGETTSAISTGKTNTFKYTGRQVKPNVAKVELNGVDVTSQFAISYLTYGENVNAGTEMGSVIVEPKSGNTNFTGTKTQLFDIKGITLDGKLKIYNSDKKQITVDGRGFAEKYFYYSGSECTFADEAFTPVSGVSVTEGTDYDIKYINNVDAGTALVAVVAKGNYEGSYTYTNDPNNWLDGYRIVDGKIYNENGKVLENNVVDVIAFNINATIFTAKNITVANGVYASGLPVKPQVTVTVAGKTLVEGTDYELEYDYYLGSYGDYKYPDSLINATDDKILGVRVNPKGGYGFDDVDGENFFAWGIDKFDFANADIKSTGNEVIVKNGSVVVDEADYVTTVDKEAGTVTVSAKEGSKNYTGSRTVALDNSDTYVGTPMIVDVQVTGNTAKVILSGETDGATGYDYVISTDRNCITTKDYDKVNKNILTTSTNFTYTQQGTYYAYCHAWKRGEDGKKVFSGWSNAYPFAVTSITPEQPSITSVKVSGSTVTVTYTKSANATGYDIVLGSAVKKVNGESRPVEYGTLVSKVTKGTTVTATFKNVKKGTYYAGLHAYNRTSADGKKVFSPWSNTKKITVK